LLKKKILVKGLEKNMSTNLVEQKISGASDLAEDLMGTWRLLSYESLHHTGEMVIPYTDKPNGRLIYTKDGDFSIHFHHPDRPKYTSMDPIDAKADECHLNFLFYCSYFGKYELLEDEMAVIHHVEGASFPNWDGEDQKRFIEYDGKQLKLVTPEMIIRGDRVVGTLRWERLYQV